jgi:hypothetical protein
MRYPAKRPPQVMRGPVPRLRGTFFLPQLVGPAKAADSEKTPRDNGLQGALAVE